VYFPAGTYLVSSPIVDYYFTQLVGNPNCAPIIKAAADFNGPWVIDGDQYQGNGQQGFLNTNIFWRQVRNFVFDLTSVPATTNIRAIHWPTAQATSIQNVVFKLSAASGTQHEGLFVENGSGGFMTDLTFYGGMIAADLGNQQFTVRNFVINNAVTAIKQLWDWGWTYQGISINDCGTGIDISAENNNFHAVGSVTFIDSTIKNTPVGILTAQDANAPAGSVPFPGIIVENVHLSNVPTAIQGPYGSLLAGSSGEMTISGWGQGNSYTPDGPTKFQGTIKPVSRPGSLLGSSGAYYARSKPQYEELPSSQFISARSVGAKGDGRTDDTAALQAAITSSASQDKVLFVDSGTYIVTRTISIPDGARIVGESYPIIMSKGSFFADMNSPQPVIQVGKPGESGYVEWSDMLISVQGAQAGAILIEWNLASPSSEPSGMWDVHARVGGTIGSQLQVSMHLISACLR
jgi:glucan 1,3-beta-glucosidase